MHLFECKICKKKSIDESDFDICIKCNEVICIDCVDHFEELGYEKPVCYSCSDHQGYEETLCDKCIKKLKIKNYTKRNEFGEEI